MPLKRRCVHMSTLPDLAVITSDFNRQHFVVIDNFLSAEELTALRQVLKSQCTYTSCHLHGFNLCAHHQASSPQECDTLLEAEGGDVGSGSSDWITSR